MNTLKNKWTFVLFGFFIVFSLLIMSQCQRQPEKKWRYEIHGQVQYKGEPHDAIWFTDSIEIGENYLRYENSNGTEVIIPSPFVLIDHKYDKVDKNYRQPFR